MLDSILSAVKGQAAAAIAEKTGLNLGQAEQALPLAGESVTEGITSAISGGNVEGIVGMLQSAVGGGEGGGGLVQNMVYKGIAGNFIQKATSALGLDEGIAGTISGIALPMIMSKLGGATQSAGDTDGIDAGSLMDTLGLDSGSLLKGAAGKLLGGGGGEGGGGGLLGGLGGMLK